MKKLITILGLALMVTACSKTGEIADTPKDFIVIHGKTYKIMSVVPCDGCRTIWIMYPKDSLDALPQSINYDVRSGKIPRNETVIKVD
jgi:hypothetical protein